MHHKQTCAVDYGKWAEHFRRNAENRREPDWNAPLNIAPHVLGPLRESIEEFQLGDGGGPAGLIALDAESFRSSSEATRELVDAWFSEEREHSRLLGCAVDRLRGCRIKAHWSFSAFCFCRRVLGVRFELQVLLLTEIVSTAYYRLMRRHCTDVAIKEMCGLILRDEAGHIAFHRDRLAGKGVSPDGIPGAIWEAQFWLCGHGAATVLWSSHGICLKTLGGSRAEFFCEVRYELARFVRSLACEPESTPMPALALPE